MLFDLNADRLRSSLYTRQRGSNSKIWNPILVLLWRICRLRCRLRLLFRGRVSTLGVSRLIINRIGINITIEVSISRMLHLAPKREYRHSCRIAISLAFKVVAPFRVRMHYRLCLWPFVPRRCYRDLPSFRKSLYVVLLIDERGFYSEAKTRAADINFPRKLLILVRLLSSAFVGLAGG